MLLGKQQEQDIKKLICPYCQSKMYSTDSHPNYFKCPQYCVHVWWSYPNYDVWMGIRIFGRDSIRLRYYNGDPTMEVYDGHDQIDIDVFDISDYSLKKLSSILESHLVSTFLIKNKKV